MPLDRDRNQCLRALGRGFFLALLALAAVFVLAYLWLVVLRTLVWWRAESFARLMETHDSSEIGVRAGLALMFIFVAVATMLRLEPILGAFLAGALFSFSFRHKGPLEVKFTSLGNGFFLFANLGLSMGEIDEGMHASIIMLAVVTSILFPFLFKAWMRHVELSPD